MLDATQLQKYWHPYWTKMIVQHKTDTNYVRRDVVKSLYCQWNHIWENYRHSKRIFKKIFSETLAHVKSHHHSSAWGGGGDETKSFQNITDRWLFAASGAYKIDFINFFKNPPGIRLTTKSHNQTFGLEHHQHVLHEFFSPENTERHKTHVLLVMVPILLKQGFCK